MLKKLRLWMKQRRCKHDHQWYVKQEMFANIQGEERFCVCSKYGKIKGSYFARYEGNGFK